MWGGGLVRQKGRKELLGKKGKENEEGGKKKLGQKNRKKSWIKFCF